MSEEYDLAKSMQKHGCLVPVITDAEGHVIDGFHRLKVDPDAPSVKLDHVKTKAELAIARLVVNTHRRLPSAQEKTELLGEIAKQTGWKAKEIAEALGMSYTWVVKYLPSEYKEPEKAEVGKVGGEAKAEEFATRRVADRPLPVLCENPDCGLGVYYPQEWHGHKLCSNCFRKAQLTPEKFLGLFNKVPKPPITEAKPKTEKPWKDKWEQRKAVMSPEHSKMEGKMQEKLQALGVKPIVTGRKFCLLYTEPDFYLPSKNIAVYLDQEEVHKNRKDRDEELRDILTKQEGLKVLPFPYKYATDREADPIARKIKEAFDQE